MQWTSLKQFLLQSGLSAECFLVFGLFVLTVTYLIFPKIGYGLCFWVCLVLLAGDFYLSGFTPEEGVSYGFRFGPYTGYLKRFFSISASVGLFGYAEWGQYRNWPKRPEIFFLFILSLLGLNLLVQSESFWLIFFCAELFSICSFALATPILKTKEGISSILTYFGVGALASSIGLFGLSWMVGFGNLPTSDPLDDLHLLSIFPTLGSILFLSFLIFKLGGFPFHFWVPKVYENAPTPLVGFISVAPKVAAAFAVLHVVQQQTIDLIPSLSILIIAGITLGNLAALRSESLKNMFAFSSIAQAGFLLVPSILGGRVPDADSQLLIFSVGYGVVNQGLFCALQYFENHLGDNLRPYHLAGQLAQHPLSAISILILILSVIGLPPTIGFTGKLLLFSTVIPSGGLISNSVTFFLFGVLVFNTLLAMGYYYKIPFQLIFKTKSLDFLTIRTSAATLFWTIMAGFFAVMAFFKPSIFFPIP